MFAVRCISRKSRLLLRINNVAALDSKRYFENILRNDPSVRDDKVVTFDNHATDAVLFSQVSTHSFLLSNGVRIVGPCLAFHRTIVSWKVRNVSDINQRSLLLLKLLVPKLDLLVIGKGSQKNEQPSGDVLRWLREDVRVAYEVLTTNRAVELYNFLNAEGRLVAAALIPPGRDDSIDEVLDEETRKRVAMRAGGDAIDMDVDEKLPFTEPFAKSLLGVGDLLDDLKAMKQDEKREKEAEKRVLERARGLEVGSGTQTSRKPDPESSSRHADTRNPKDTKSATNQSRPDKPEK